MKITDILKTDHIINNLSSLDKEGALKEFSEFLEQKRVINDKGALLKALIEREKLGSTGIGENVAIPHAKLDEIANITTVFAKSQDGIEFESLDQKPVHFICLVIAPSNSTGLHLKALARISRLLKSSSLRDAVLAATEAEQIYTILVEEDAKFL